MEINNQSEVSSLVDQTSNEKQDVDDPVASVDTLKDSSSQRLEFQEESNKSGKALVESQETKPTQCEINERLSQIIQTPIERTSNASAGNIADQVSHPPQNEEEKVPSNQNAQPHLQED